MPALTQLAKKLLLVRVEDRRGISHLTVARSADGITNWQIDAQPTFLPDPEHYQKKSGVLKIRVSPG